MDSDDWLKSFRLLTQFSVRTMTAITCHNGVVTQKCRTEIIQTLAGEIWRHTRYPSSNAYNTICANLIKEFPHLTDDDDPGYVSCHCHVLHLIYTNKCKPISKVLTYHFLEVYYHAVDMEE